MSVEIVMTRNLFRGSRMNGVVLPDAGETVEIDEDSAKRLVEAKHAAYVDEPAEPADEVPEGDENPEPEAPAKRGPGRPRKE